MASQNKEGHLYKKFSIKELIAYFRTPQQILTYYFIAFRVTRWFVELKMAILEQFKLLNLNQKNLRKLCTDEVIGVKMKKMKNMHFAIWKNIFSLLPFSGCSFGFAFQRWFVKLEKELL
jgi:hypothetical protein